MNNGAPIELWGMRKENDFDLRSIKRKTKERSIIGNTFKYKGATSNDEALFD